MKQISAGFVIKALKKQIIQARLILTENLLSKSFHCVKSVKYGVIPGPYFPVFGLYTDIYGVNIGIQSEYRKIWTRDNSVFGHFSRIRENLYSRKRVKSSFSWNYFTRIFTISQKCENSPSKTMNNYFSRKIVTRHHLKTNNKAFVT